jgi:hypothetical protein
MSEADSATRLRNDGVALLRGVFATEALAVLKEAADRCFAMVAANGSFTERYRFNPFSHSVLLAALADFGCDEADLTAPLSAPGFGPLLSETMGCDWVCNLEQSWVRKKFAPNQIPSREYYPQGWHQDGALGVTFPAEPGAVVPMTELLTCWIPLNPCGTDSPGLEFVRGRQPALLHFTELDDMALRRRFRPEEFWAPLLEFGDGLVFLNSVLHRTYVQSEMSHDRTSVEFRIFPC